MHIEPQAEALAARYGGQALLELARFTGEDERRIARELAFGRFERGAVGVGRKLARLV